jgi:hypothetical protein
MTTLNTKKVGGGYEYDPFSEYHHPQEDVSPEQPFAKVAATEEVDVAKSKEQLLKNIDDMFDGDDFIFDIANKFMKRLGGK